MAVYTKAWIEDEQDTKGGKSRLEEHADNDRYR